MLQVRRISLGLQSKQANQCKNKEIMHKNQFGLKMAHTTFMQAYASNWGAYAKYQIAHATIQEEYATSKVAYATF